MMTIKQIREDNALNTIESYTDQQLLEAYGTINQVKKDMSDLESSIKSKIQARFDAGTGFKGITDAEATTAGVWYKSSPVDVTSYHLDIPALDMYNLMNQLGFEDYSKRYSSITFTSSNLSKLKIDNLHPQITKHILKDKSTILKIK